MKLRDGDLVKLRDGSILRGIGAGLACLVPTPVSRAQTLATSYSIGWAVDPGVELLSIGGSPDDSPWARTLLPMMTSAASWTALHSAVVPLLRRSPVPAPLLALGYAAAVAALDSKATEATQAMRDRQPAGVAG